MLSKEQQEAVNSTEGQTLVVSCPGSGKTTVMVARTKQLINNGVDSSKILVNTFMKAAAQQMQERFEKQFGKTNTFFCTIHALCFRVIAKAYGYRREDLLNAVDQYEFFRNKLYKRVETDDIDEYIKQMISEISYIRNKEIPPSVYEPVNSKKEIFVPIYHAYEEYKHELGKIDFDDMLILCRECFREKPDELKFWQDKYPYIMIDEYQDTNSIQADIFYMLAGKDGNLFVVGDDDQSIYRFRSADSDIMLGFPKEYPKAKVIHLSTNYRSEPEIIHFAGNLIKHNQNRFQKKFQCCKTGKGLVKVRQYDNTQAQAEAIAEMISKYHEANIPFEEMAVLYRTNAQNQLPIGSFLKRDIPFYTTDPPKDYHNEFMFGDFMAYYRLAEGCWQKGDVQRILNRPGRYLKAECFKGVSYEEQALLNACRKMGASSSRAMAQIFSMESDINMLKGKKPKEFLQLLLHTIGYDRFVDDYCEFCQKDKTSTRMILNILIEEGSRFDSMQDWKAYADYYAEQLQKKRKETKKNGVCLSTFHSAKGLEWDVVFIIDAAEGFSPYAKAETAEDYEEERRLFYVGMTRARKVLNMSYVLGDKKKNGYSRYIAEMGYPEKDIIVINTENKKDAVANPTLRSLNSSTKKQAKFYAVKRINGLSVDKIYTKWYGTGGCKEVVSGKRAVYKSFNTREEAEEYLEN